MKISIMDTPFKVKHVKQIAGFIEAVFLSHLQASQAYYVNCVLNQCQQLSSSVRELNDKYPGSCLCLLQQWKRESYTIMFTVGVIILEYPTSGVVLKLFQPAKSKIHQDWTIVCWRNEAGD